MTRTARFNPGWYLVAPLLVLVAVMFAGPLANILWLSFTDPEPGLTNYAALIEKDSLRRLVWTTVRICLITTALSVILGYSIAYAMANVAEAARQRMMLFILISFWISVLVRTFSWMMLLGRKGLVNNGLPRGLFEILPVDTALAAHLHHRVSRVLDFFSTGIQRIAVAR